jgi:Tfp pilus assembly protein PilN
MINLLSAQGKKIFTRMYILRLLTVALSMGAVLVVIHSVLLIPSYVFLQARIANQEVEGEFLGKTLEASGSDEVEERLTALTAKLTLLETLESTPLFVSAIEDVLEVSRTGIQVTNIAYTPNDPKVQISIRGIAKDRDALRSFAKRLEEREGIASVDFPIGNLSKEKDLPFSISIVLAS